MKYQHREAVKSVAEKLLCAGWRGRADHIGEHQSLFSYFLIQNFTKSSSTKKYLGGRCPIFVFFQKKKRKGLIVVVWRL